LNETLTIDLIPITKKVSTPLNMGISWHGWYHHNYEDKIKEYLALETKIKNLIQASYLQIFIQIDPNPSHQIKRKITNVKVSIDQTPSKRGKTLTFKYSSKDHN